MISTEKEWTKPEWNCDMSNLTFYGNITDKAALDYSLAQPEKLITGSVIFFAVLPFVLFNFKCFPIGTTSALLLGATLMVGSQVVTQDEAYEVLGHKDNLTTIFLLLGMMLVAQYFEREQMLMKILRHFLQADFTFANYIWRVCLLSFLLSALFTNDASCAILTPLLLKVWEVQERPTSELQSILLGVATSANIGSVITIFGNPQMALIAAKTNTHPYLASKLDLRRSLLYLGPPAVIALVLNILFLLLHQRCRTNSIEKSKLISENSHSEQEMAGLTAGHRNGGDFGDHKSNGSLRNEQDELLFESSGLVDKKLPCELETIPEDDVLEIISTRSDLSVSMDLITVCKQGPSESNGMEDHQDTQEEDEDENYKDQSLDLNSSRKQRLEEMNSLSLDVEYKPSALQHSSMAINDSVSSLSRSIEERSLQLSRSLGIYRSIGAFSAADFFPPKTGQLLSDEEACEENFAPSDSVLFQVLISAVVLLILSLFLASGESITFDMGLIPMGGAVLCVIADAIINRQTSHIILRRVDWSIIMMFFGMFVYMHGLNSTRLPRFVWKKLGLASVSHLSPYNILILAIFIIIGSNVFSNVPLTMIVLEQLVPCNNQFALVVILAWCATIAGNLTLFGSVANLIVAQKGEQTLKYRLTFFGYLRYGFCTTLVITVMGIFLLYGFLQIQH